MLSHSGSIFLSTQITTQNLRIPKKIPARKIIFFFTIQDELLTLVLSFINAKTL